MCHRVNFVIHSRRQISAQSAAAPAAAAGNAGLSFNLCSVGRSKVHADTFFEKEGSHLELDAFHSICGGDGWVCRQHRKAEPLRP